MNKRSQFLAMALCALATAGIGTGRAPAQPVTAAAPTQSPPPFAGGWEGTAETRRWPLFLTLQLKEAGGEGAGTLHVLGNEIALSSLRTEGDNFTILIGDGPQAIKLEGRRRGWQLVGTLTQGDDVLPFTLERIPDYPKPASRDQAWLQDLDALEKRFLAVDRSFDGDERARFLAALAGIRDGLSEMTDAEVMMRMASAIALADNAHTRLYLLRNRSELRRMPIRLWWFSDGLHVVRTDPEHRELLGCRVDRIGGFGAREARDKVAPAYAGTDGWDDYMSVYSLTSPEALQGMGVAPDADAVDYVFSDCAAAGRRTLRPLPLVRSDDAVEAWWDLTPAHPGAGADWPQALQSSADALPLYLRNPEANYWFEFIPETGILYFQYNRSSDMPGEKTSAFAERLLAELARQPVKALVIDLRFNTGGNLTLAADLMKTLQQRTKGMERFVITGRATFSAGISALASWREAGDVTVIGEPVGDVGDFWSEGGNIILPNSGLAAHFANGAHSYSPAPCPPRTYCLDMSAPSLAPDVATPLSWTDYRRGIDPAMAAVAAALGR